MKIIVIGCGRMGAGLARVLDGAGHTVTVVDIDERSFRRLGPSFGGTRLHGVGFDREVLLQAGIGGADGVAAVTGDDEVNALVARVAGRVFHVPKVVARLHDPRKADIYRRLGVQVVATVDWGIRRTADLLTFSDVGELISLGSGQVDLVQVEVPHLLAGRSVDEVSAPGEVLPVAISRAGRTFIPTTGTTLHAGDIVHLAVVGASRNRLVSMLGIR
ncbi:MAG TPA: TrkA family potassium uptake protein [Acidimicrobiales bacterium]